MRFFVLILFLISAFPAFAQSGRIASATAPVQSITPSNGQRVDLTVKQMFDDANGYVRAKFAEYSTKKIPYNEDLLERTKLEQRQLAAKYATKTAASKTLAGDDFYYLGMLNWIALNLDGTIENLRKFIASETAAADRRQTARSIIAVVFAKQRKPDDAEAILAEYLKTEPAKLTERARMEGEIAKAYQAKQDFVRMAPHAEEAYKAAKALLKDAASVARGMDEILDAGMLVFEAYRDGGNQKKADDALEDMRLTAATVGSSSFYYYAVDKKIQYLIDLGQKSAAMEYYLVSLINAGKDFTAKPLQNDVISRLKKKENQYKVLGERAPEMTSVDQWFPGTRKTFAEMKGKVILLDFWATWCQPCIEAFPAVKEWHQDFGRDGIEILGITRYYGEAEGLKVDNEAELAYFKRFRDKHGLPYDLIVSRDQGIGMQYGVTALPTTVIIDRKGIIRYIETGTSPTRLEEIRAEIEKLIAEK